MKRTVLIFGLASGALSAAMMIAMVPFMLDGIFRHGELIGYTSIVLASLLVFFGVRSYREKSGGAHLTFRRGLAVGVSIAAVSALCYATTWVVLSTVVIPDLNEKLVACMVDQKRAAGASPQEIEATARQARQWSEWAKNPLINFGLTLVEPLPIGLLASLISAGILRRRQLPAGASRGVEA
jgi:amino acid transporter